MLSALIGLVFMVLGVWGIIQWWPSFVIAVKGLLPVCIFTSGAVAMIVGLSSLSAGSAKKSKK